MPSSVLPPVVLLTRITRFIEAQDGAETQKQLIPSLLASLPPYSARLHTAQTISEIIKKSQDRAKRLRAVLAKRDQLNADWNELQESLSSSRLRPERRAQLHAEHASLIRAYSQRKPIKKEARDVADEKLSEALAALRQKNVRRTAEWKERQREEKEEAKAKRLEERKLAEEKEAANRAERKAIDEQKRAAEVELRVRLTDQRGRQLMDAKAKRLDMEQQRQKDAELARATNREMREALRLWTNRLRREDGLAGLPEHKYDDADGSNDQQENKSPVQD